MRKSFLSLLMFMPLTLSSVGSSAQPVALAPTPAPAPLAPTATSESEDLTAKLTVPVMIDGKGPFQFVIDTGADRTVISRELAEQLKLPGGEKKRIHAMGGSAMVSTVKIRSVQVATNHLKNVTAPALARRYLGADGLLGIDSLKGLRITMDFKDGTIVAEPSTAPPPPPVASGDTIIVTAKTRLGQLVMVDADANGQKLWVVVDTGTADSVGNSKLRSTLLKKQKISPPKPISLVDVLGKVTPADYTIVEHVRLGGLHVKGAAIAFADIHPFALFDLKGKPSMFLGMSTLRHFRRVTIDFSTRKVTFVLPSAL